MVTVAVVKWLRRWDRDVGGSHRAGRCWMTVLTVCLFDAVMAGFRSPWCMAVPQT